MIDMYDELRFERIDAIAAVNAVNATLRRIDERLIDHGERVAYIACRLCELGGLELDIKTLFLLSIFHDIGAYKTDEIDRMVEFETREVWSYAIYGGLFLKYLTPLSSHADAIVYHHCPWSVLEKLAPCCRDYAAMIHLADRIDIVLAATGDERRAEELVCALDGVFRPEYVAVMRRCFREDGGIGRGLRDGSYRAVNMERCAAFRLPVRETLEYLKMLVYSIDFRSEYTVTHTINTVSLSMYIAARFALGEEELEKLYLGALLHDVGKIAIPVSIVENPGKLSDEEMRVMRTHVRETDELIRGIVPEDIRRIAARHHEKLDGSGYPLGLTGGELSFSERVVAVADIVSALSSRRSYKEPFPAERTVAILGRMAGTQLDGDICAYVIDNYATIIADTEEARGEIIDKYRHIMTEYAQLKKELDV